MSGFIFVVPDNWLTFTADELLAASAPPIAAITSMSLTTLMEAMSASGLIPVDTPIYEAQVFDNEILCIRTFTI